MKLKLALLLLCVAFMTVTTGCGKRKSAATTTNEASAAPGTASATESEFQVATGNEGLDTVGKDLPLGEQPPDPNQFVDPSAMPEDGGEGGGDQAGLPPGAAEVFADVYFAFDSYQLSRDSREVLARIGAYLAANAGVSVIVEGHCDERGTAAYNLALGEKRALAIREFLAGMRVNPTRVSTISYGEERPADPAHDEQAWSKNRRGHFRVSAR